MASTNKALPVVQLRKRAKEIIEWIDAYIVLVDLDIKYFELSINAKDKRMRNKYRSISEKYHELITKLIEKIP